MRYHVERIDVPDQDTAVVRAVVDPDQVAEFLGGAFAEVLAALAAQGSAPSGPPFGRFVPAEAGLEVEAGFPAARAIEASGRVVPGRRTAGPALRVLHRGPYDQVTAAFAAAEQWMAENGWEGSAPPWEEYLDGPEVAQPRTLVHVPCRPR